MGWQRLMGWQRVQVTRTGNVPLSHAVVPGPPCGSCRSERLDDLEAGKCHPSTFPCTVPVSTSTCHACHIAPCSAYTAHCDAHTVQL
eukprot:1289790-Prymnesium_polylepis.3